MKLGTTLITGGAGFLGRALIARLQDDCEVIVYSRDELKQSLCRRKYPRARYVLGDVRDEERLRLVMAGVDNVIHTAAMKYVPDGERNVSEVIAVNVGGTQAVLSAARAAGVTGVVIVSTDKAVQPVNVYGASKMLCERLVGECAEWDHYTKVTCVRYGNVVGSTGSVIPELWRQAEETGEVTITDPEMTRFWLGVEDAVYLVMDAFSEDVLPGSVIVPECGALTMARLAEYVAPDARVKVVGPRPGEKKHETLLTRDESRWARLNNAGGFYGIVPLPLRDKHNGQPVPFQITSETAEEIEHGAFVDMIGQAEALHV